MDQLLPKPLVMVQNVEKLRLPVSSYRQNGGSSYAKFTPFIVSDDGGIWEHNQLNWIVLYLLSMNEEEISGPDSNVLNQILNVEKVTKDTQERINELAAQLSKNFQNSEEIKGMLEKVQNNKDLQAIKDKINEALAGKPMGSRLTKIEKSIEKLSKRMEALEGLGKKIDFIASKFGYES